jgi:hypothetical protein
MLYLLDEMFSGALKGSIMSTHEYTKARVRQKVLIGPSPERGFLQRTCACGGSPGIDGLCAECRRSSSYSRGGFEDPSALTIAQGNSSAQESVSVTSLDSVMDRASRLGYEFDTIPIFSREEKSSSLENHQRRILERTSTFLRRLPPHKEQPRPPRVKGKSEQAREGYIVPKSLERPDQLYADPAKPFQGAASLKPNACAAPKSLKKIISGPFEGGVSLETYYPNAHGEESGTWLNGNIAGPWNTGQVAGANIQIVGTIPGPCNPEFFFLGQTVKTTLFVENGKHTHPEKEGVLRDDVAENVDNPDHSSFRQEWLGPEGLHISTADPPSVSYNRFSNIQADTTYVTWLAGLGGKSEIAWKTSIRVVNGEVVKNTLE